jgi:hypothetical protein
MSFEGLRDELDVFRMRDEELEGLLVTSVSEIPTIRN